LSWMCLQTEVIVFKKIQGVIEEVYRVPYKTRPNAKPIFCLKAKAKVNTADYLFIMKWYTIKIKGKSKILSILCVLPVYYTLCTTTITVSFMW